MKFTFAVIAWAVSTSVTNAFAPIKALKSTSSALGMSAVQTPTYTFTKSEEVFAEALEVSLDDLIDASAIFDQTSFASFHKTMYILCR